MIVGPGACLQVAEEIPWEGWGARLGLEAP